MSASFETNKGVELEWAAQQALELQQILGRGTFEEWIVAGSVRRQSVIVGDVDHVIIPKLDTVEVGDGLFASETAKVNLVWHALEKIIGQDVGGFRLEKHLYGNAETPRWGPKTRGIDVITPELTLRHELRMTTRESLGAALAIYTGPAEFAKELVTGLLRNRRRNKDGSVWECARCTCGGHHLCKGCDGTGLTPAKQLIVPTEEEYFALCGVAYVEPQQRR
jgi:DNA polymerase/3'-5' exonuclease PolX